MPGIIEGYNYDIFISYRQKDNKGDGWVSEFVEALKTELGSNFKEEISVYFDINPHDGLLETHDVKASLKEKLNCLIFIPIISRTYCDTGSYAWENEFRAFIQMASGDRYGLKVKLPDGNVASRVLPVQIHQLEQAEKKIIEDELGGYLRSVEFIYRQPGINKPLRPDDDEKINLNRTKYSYQVNKVANAIREIMGGFRNEHSNAAFNQSNIMTEPKRISDKSIIVLPFDNISPDADQEYFSDGLTEEIITDLSYIHDLLVISRSSAMTFKGSKKTIPEIAREVNVRYVLEGSVRKAGNNLRIIAQLIDAVTDTHIWAEKFNGTLDDVFEIQEKVAQSISNTLKIKLTSAEKSRLTQVPIPDLVSYELYLRAKTFVWTFTESGLDQAMKLINEALEHSGNNALLYASRGLITWQYYNSGFRATAETLDLAGQDAAKALDIDPGCSAAYSVKGYIAYSRGLIDEVVSNYSRVSDAESLAMKGYAYALAGHMDKSGSDFSASLKVDPLNMMTLCGYSYYHIFRGDYDAAARLLLKAGEMDPSNPLVIYYYALTRIYSGDRSLAVESFEKLDRIDGGVFGLQSIMWRAALEGREKDFDKWVENMREYAVRDKELSWWVADCSALLGRPGDVYFWLGNSVELGFFNDAFFSKYDPLLQPYRDDPGFITVMNKARSRQEQFRANLGI